MSIRYITCWHNIQTEVTLDLTISEVTSTIDMNCGSSMLWTALRFDFDNLGWIIEEESLWLCYILIVNSESHFSFGCKGATNGTSTCCLGRTRNDSHPLA